MAQGAPGEGVRRERQADGAEQQVRHSQGNLQDLLGFSPFQQRQFENLNHQKVICRVPLQLVAGEQRGEGGGVEERSCGANGG